MSDRVLQLPCFCHESFWNEAGTDRRANWVHQLSRWHWWRSRWFRHHIRSDWWFSENQTRTKLFQQFQNFPSDIQDPAWWFSSILSIYWHNHFQYEHNCLIFNQTISWFSWPMSQQAILFPYFLFSSKISIVFFLLILCSQHNEFPTSNESTCSKFIH